MKKKSIKRTTSSEQQSSQNNTKWSNKAKKLAILIFTILTISTIWIGATFSPAKADGESIIDETLKYALLRGVGNCLRSNLDMPENPNFSVDGNVDYDIERLFGDDEEVKTIAPNIRFGESIKEENLNYSCLEVFSGRDSGDKGIYNYINRNEKYFMKDDMVDERLGYHSDSSEDTKVRCYHYTYKANVANAEDNPQVGESIPFCFVVISDFNEEEGTPRKYEYLLGGIHDNPSDDDDPCQTYYSILGTAIGGCDNNSKNPLKMDIVIEESDQVTLIDYYANSKYEVITINHTDPVNIEESLKNHIHKTDFDEVNVIFFEAIELKETNITLPSYKYQKIDKNIAAKNAIKFFYGGDITENELVLSDQQKFDLLSYYIKGTINSVDEITTKNGDCKDNPEMYLVPAQNSDNSIKWCPLLYHLQTVDDSNIGSIKGAYSVPHNEFFLSIGTFNDVLQHFYELATRDDIEKQPLDSIQYTQPEDAPSDGDPDLCYNSNSVGWIICPILDAVSDAMSKLYNNIAEDFLVVSPDLVSNESVKGVFDVIVNIANIAMILFLLIVIFSQLTGIGIDNYGIKKTLPKLIVVAILINISYLLCRLLVDLSNILGYSLNEWLTNIEIEPNLTDVGLSNTNISTQSGWFNAIFTIVAGGLVTVGGYSIVSGVLQSNLFAGIVLPVLILFITALFAILFFFILLGLRKAGIVILIAIAPLAVLCYALPNTKKHFDKWLKAFQSLLLLYPICGILIGGGTFISKLLITVSTDGMMYFVACLIMVVPFFLIPSLLKGSFKAMGNIGATVSGYGRRMRGWSTKRIDSGIRNNERFKRRVQQNQQLHQLRQDQADIRRSERLNHRAARIKASGGTLSRRQQIRLNEATKAANIARQRREETRQGVFEISDTIAAQRAETARDAQELKSHSEEFGALTRKQMETELKQAVSDYNGDKNNHQYALRLQAAIREAERRGMDGETLSGAVGLTKLKLKADNTNDAAILNELASSKNIVLNQYGKEMSKKPNEELSVNDFARGINSNANLSECLKRNGSNTLVGANDDILKYIKEQNIGAATPEMIMKGIAGATNDKQLEQYHDMLRHMIYSNPDSINLSGDILTKADAGSLKILADEVMDNPTSNFARRFISASNDIAKNPNALSNLSNDRRTLIDNARIATGGEIMQNVQQAQINQQASAQQAQTLAAQDAARSAHQTFAATQGKNLGGLYPMPNGWQTVPGFGYLAQNPNNPNEKYNRKTNTFFTS